MQLSSRRGARRIAKTVIGADRRDASKPWSPVHTAGAAESRFTVDSLHGQRQAVLPSNATDNMMRGGVPAKNWWFG